MIGKKLTIFVLPQGVGHVKVLKCRQGMPFVFMAIFFILFCCASGFAYYSWSRLEDYKGTNSEIRRLRQENREQKIQVFAFADKIRLLEQEMGKLRQSDLKLRAMSMKGTIASAPAALGVGGSEASSQIPHMNLKAGARQLIRRMHVELEQLLNETGRREQSQQELGRYLEDARSIMASTRTPFPLNGDITSFYGYRTSPFGGQSTEFHRGIDITSGVGTPVKAPADGIVLASEYNSGYGLILTINHGYGVVTRYAHLAKVYVEPGDIVKKGQKVCATGMSGRTTGPHLHYETIFNGVPVNPLRFLSFRE